MHSKDAGGADLDAVGDHYTRLLRQHGTTSEGVGWGSSQRQEERFRQIAQFLDFSHPFSLLDVGCGYGAFFDYLAAKAPDVDFLGVDVAPDMIAKARALHSGDASRCRFEIGSLPEGRFDYVTASGIFNVVRAPSVADWRNYIFDAMRQMHVRCRRAMICNFLTSHSDTARKEADLYYADPAEMLDFCVRELSMNVSLAHHYGIWDFTRCVFSPPSD